MIVRCIYVQVRGGRILQKKVMAKVLGLNLMVESPLSVFSKSTK